jgi:UDP-glucuronate 4-epimerase
MVLVIEKVLGHKAELTRLPSQSGDVERTFADITKAREILGYNPDTSFAEGVDRFVNWYRSINR